MAIIRNGSAYPAQLRKAAVKASKRTKQSLREVAADFNVAPSTLSTWKRIAGLNKPQPAGLAAHQAAAAAVKAFNTPTLKGPTNTLGVVVPATATEIEFRGKTYII